MYDLLKYPLVEAGEIIEAITKEAAEKTGLKEGTSLVSCSSDKTCKTLGVGALDKTPPGNRGLLLQPYWGAGNSELQQA